MEEDIKKLIAIALKEDFQKEGDITSGAIFGDERFRAALISKGSGVLAGREIFESVFRFLDPHITVNLFLKDGETLSPGTTVAEIEGSARVILSCERTALNFISFLSGIASKTKAFVDEAERYGTTVILDTRKTLPGFRTLSKQAVRAGGGQNHREGLFDMVLIKDNHIDASGSITGAIERIRDRWGDTFAVEVECRTLAEVKEALQNRVDRIMLDNMDFALLEESLAVIAGKIPAEISGNVGLEDLKKLVPLGATYISVGALTHSVNSFDFSLIVEKV